MSESISLNTSRGLSGNTLKLIAIITMLIDHIGVTLVCEEPFYTICRGIGRLAFPIFCFLLVEGFFYTQNIMHYGIRLLLFALISEIPFDLVFHHELYNFHYQNVFFTLFIGLITLVIFAEIDKRFTRSILLRKISKIFILFFGMFIAYAVNTDYSYIGILTIIIFYEFYTNRLLATVLACCCLSFLNILEFTALLDIFLICCYNGKRGFNLKYLFYLFYPLHLLLLYYIEKSFL